MKNNEFTVKIKFEDQVFLEEKVRGVKGLRDVFKKVTSKYG